MCALSRRTPSADQLGAAVGDQVLLGEETGVLLTRLITLTMRSTWFRSPTAACSVPSRSMAMARAACAPVAVSMVAAELADPGFAVALGDVAGDEDQLAGAHEGHVGSGRHGHRRQRDAELGEAVVDVGHSTSTGGQGRGANPTLRPWEDRQQNRPAHAAGSRCLLAVPAGVALQLQQRALLGRWRLPGTGLLLGVLLVCAAWRWRRPRVSLLSLVAWRWRWASAAPAGARVAAAGRVAAGERSKGATCAWSASSPACRRPGRTGIALPLRGRAARTMAGEPVVRAAPCLAGLVQRLPRRRHAACSRSASCAPASAGRFNGAAAPAARHASTRDGFDLRVVCCSSRVLRATGYVRANDKSAPQLR